MRWVTENPATDERAALKAHLARALPAAACTREEAAALEEVADAVATYCVREAGPGGVPEPLLWFALSRALCAAGYRRFAADVLRRYVHAGRDPQAYLSVLDEAPAEGASLWRACAHGLLRPSTWSGEHTGPMWVLECAMPGWCATELALHRALAVALHRLAGVWDRTSGDGLLALKGLAGLGAGSPQDWLLLCRALLRRERTRRGWSHAPRVLSLDVRPGRAKR